MTQPHPAHPAGGDRHPLQPQLVGDPRRPVGRPLQAVVEDLLLDLGRDEVRMRAARPALLLDQGAHPAGLERPANLLEGVAVVAHDPAGLGDVAQFVGELQQRELAFDTVRQSSHLGFS